MPANTTTSTTANNIGSAPFSSTTTPANVAFPNAAVAALGQASDIYNQSMPMANGGDPSAGFVLDPNSPGIPAGQPYTSVPNTWVNQGIGLNTSLAQQVGPSGLTAYNTAIDRYENPFDKYVNKALGQYQDIYKGAQDYNVPIGNLQPLAANTSGALTDVQQQILADNAERLGNRLASQYSGSGRYGSFGAGIGLARGVAETNNPLTAQFNQQNIGNALQANSLYGNLLGGKSQQQLAGVGGYTQTQGAAKDLAYRYGQLLPTMQQNMYMPGQVLQDAGNYMLNYPWQQLSNSVKALQGATPSAGTSTSGTQPVNMGSTTTASQPTPWTTYAGLGLAGAGLLCDRRLKMDIEPAGYDPVEDWNVYTFHYKWQQEGEPKIVGPMADEVMLKYPDRVVSIGGILHVRV